MSTYYETCKNCNSELIVDDGDNLPGGLRDNERIFCPKCNAELQPVYTSGRPSVTYTIN